MAEGAGVAGRSASPPKGREAGLVSPEKYDATGFAGAGSGRGVLEQRVLFEDYE